jgi:UDP-N-acetyl-2-amino-2-deoxyglucuronate dehydrogenase
MTTRAKIAVIGCGRIAGHHCRSITKTDGADLIAVCDLIPEKAHAYHDEFGAAAYTDYRLMLEEHPEVNTVSVITPSGMHFEHGLEIIERFRKNIIVEKPTFMTPSQLVGAYGAARERGLQIFPVFQNRHNRAVQRVKRGLEAGELGEIRTVAVRVRWCRPQRYYALSQWRGTMAMDGGALTNQGVHHVDLMRYCGGEVTQLAVSMGTLGVEVDVEDTVVAAVKFQSGALGAVEVTTAARPHDYEASISLVGDKGVAQIGGVAANELQIYTPEPDAASAHSEDFQGNVYGHGHEQRRARHTQAAARLLRRGRTASVDRCGDGRRQCASRQA